MRRCPHARSHPRPHGTHDQKARKHITNNPRCISLRHRRSPGSMIHALMCGASSVLDNLRNRLYGRQAWSFHGSKCWAAMDERCRTRNHGAAALGHAAGRFVHGFGGPMPWSIHRQPATKTPRLDVSGGSVQKAACGGAVRQPHVRRRGRPTVWMKDGPKGLGRAPEGARSIASTPPSRRALARRKRGPTWGAALPTGADRPMENGSRGLS